jgi:4'-phosphopantetheinyl transferase
MAAAARPSEVQPLSIRHLPVTVTARALVFDDSARVPETAYFTEVERRRMARFRCDSALRQFQQAHLLARLLLADRLGVAAACVPLVQRCPTCGSVEHGRPQPQGLHVSWAHAAGAVIAAVSPDPVGVDVESVAAFDTASDGLPAVVCTPRELAGLPADPAARRRALVRLWTVKEALIKVGVLELDTMRRFDAGLPIADAAAWQGRVGQWVLTCREHAGFAFAVAANAAVSIEITGRR